MLNYEYDAEAERRVLREEAYQEGFQKGFQEVLDLVTKLVEECLSTEAAIDKAKELLSGTTPPHP